MSTENTVEKQGKPHLFKKGQSGNPNGRPKGSKNFSTLFREAVKQIAEETGTDAERELVLTAIEEARNGKFSYHKDIFDRVYGQAEQKHEVDASIQINLVNYGDSNK